MTSRLGRILAAIPMDSRLSLGGILSRVSGHSTLKDWLQYLVVGSGLTRASFNASSHSRRPVCYWRHFVSYTLCTSACVRISATNFFNTPPRPSAYCLLVYNAPLGSTSTDDELQRAMGLRTDVGKWVSWRAGRPDSPARDCDPNNRALGPDDIAGVVILTGRSERCWSDSLVSTQQDSRRYSHERLKQPVFADTPRAEKIGTADRMHAEASALLLGTLINPQWLKMKVEAPHSHLPTLPELHIFLIVPRNDMTAYTNRENVSVLISRVQQEYMPYRI
ncbi:hypothetical protein EDB89DRAFT_2249512 [Lactarius sanguifluus]|nr:hypothetical protein EDB89DRAFT_2249512 [Lactarius sanguifluus]